MHDLRRLHALVAIADHGSFSDAAVELGYAQSVVSHHIAALEREMGVQLVDRGSRPVQFTEAGVRLVGHSREILGRLGDAEDEMRAIAGLRAGRLRVSAFLVAGITFIPEVVRSFTARHPDVELELEQRATLPALEALRSGALDLAVIWTPEEIGDAGDGLSVEVLGHEPYRIVLPADHRLARLRRPLTLADLSDEAFTFPRPAGDGARYLRWLERRCEEAGFAPRLEFPVDDVMVARAFIGSGLCVGLLPHLTVAGGGREVAIRELPGDHGYRTISAQWRSGRVVPAIAPMLELLREAVPRAIGAGLVAPERTA